MTKAFIPAARIPERMKMETDNGDQHSSEPPSKRETSNLIGTDKVEGTPVYRSNGDRVG